MPKRIKVECSRCFGFKNAFAPFRDIYGGKCFRCHGSGEEPGWAIVKAKNEAEAARLYAESPEGKAEARSLHEKNLQNIKKYLEIIDSEPIEDGRTFLSRIAMSLAALTDDPGLFDRAVARVKTRLPRELIEDFNDELQWATQDVDQPLSAFSRRHGFLG